jgi:putative transposase
MGGISLFMARPLRIEYPGAWYHVMNRGADRKKTFHSSKYFELFFDLLEQAHQRFGIEVHAYCLMNNHYHLLIRTPYPNLNKVMRLVNGLYTQKYNKLENKDGPLFRGRYKAILVEAESYFLTLMRYIHLNPVKANLVSSPEEYPWSSYKCYLNQQHRPSWLYCDETLSRFSSGDSLKEYIAFTNEGINNDEIEKFYTNPNHLPILGSKVFVEKINSDYLSPTPPCRLPEHKNISKTLMPSVVDIIEAVAKYYKTAPLDIKNNIKRTSKNTPRNIAIYLALKFSGQDRKLIALEFSGISYLSLSAITRKTDLAIQKDCRLLQDVENIKKKLIACLDLTPHPYFTRLISSYGVKINEHYLTSVDNQLTMDVLFNEK